MISSAYEYYRSLSRPFIYSDMWRRNLETIRRRVTDNLIDAIEAMTAPTYNTVPGVVDELRTVFEMAGDIVTLVEELPIFPEPYAGIETDVFRYAFFYLSAADDSRPEDPAQYRYRNVAADFQRAVMVDRTRGGLAKNTTFETHGIGTFSDGSICMPCVYIICAVVADTDQLNPYRLGM